MFPRNYWSSSFSRCRTRGGLSNSAAYCFSISFYTIVVVITVVVASRHRRLFLLVFCIIPIFFFLWQPHGRKWSTDKSSVAKLNYLVKSGQPPLSLSLGPTAVWLVLFSSSAIWSPHIWKLNHLTPQLETIDGGGAAILSSQMKTSLPAFESKKNVVKKETGKRRSSPTITREKKRKRGSQMI